jgi:hypothetical protein
MFCDSCDFKSYVHYLIAAKKIAINSILALIRIYKSNPFLPKI